VVAKPAVIADDVTRADMRRWLDTWKRVGPILDAERVANLRKMDEAESARIAVASLWPMARVGAGDWGEGLAPMKDALRRLAARR
jgi:hypothetical protein